MRLKKWPKKLYPLGDKNACAKCRSDSKHEGALPFSFLRCFGKPWRAARRAALPACQRQLPSHTKSASLSQYRSSSQGNEVFKQGNVPAAIVAYKAALESTVLGENRLPLLSNLSLCHLKDDDLKASASCLTEALALGVACYASPGLAVKAAGRWVDVCSTMGNFKSERQAISDARFYLKRAKEKNIKPPAGLRLPMATDPVHVTALLSAIGAVGATEGEEGLAAVRAALRTANAEDLDNDRMNALALAIHVEGMRPVLGGSLLSLLLESGAPPDARHEEGRTAVVTQCSNCCPAACQQ